MKLGLWFGPLEAAATSEAVREHPQWRLSKDGVIEARILCGKQWTVTGCV